MSTNKIRVNITIDPGIHSRIPGNNKSQFLEEAATEKLNAGNEIRIPVSPAIREWLYAVATIKNLTVADWMLSEFLLEARGWFTHCPKCRKPVNDVREINFMPDDDGILKYDIECPFCGHTWEHKNAI
jgi:hypothetical protein